MTTIVLGGTGFLGLHAVGEILDRGERVVVTTHRRNHETPALRAAVDRGDAVVEPVGQHPRHQRVSAEGALAGGGDLHARLELRQHVRGGPAV
jgi:nucleoside-diphosphate-sugar epimerase